MPCRWWARRATFATERATNFHAGSHQLARDGCAWRADAGPNYGDQLQNRALQGQSFELSYSYKPVPEEANVYLDWINSKAELADGTIVELRKPKIRIEKLNFGPLADNVQTSLRIAQPVFGMGLLEAVPEQTLRDISRAKNRKVSTDA